VTFLRAFYKKNNAGYLLIALPVMAAEWILFKCLYPFADYFTDSYSYIEAAAQRDVIGYRPMGYSIFLRIIHALWASDTFLVTLQYVLVQGACLGLFFGVINQCRPGRLAALLLLGCMLLNPAIPYLCNYVSSDAVFVGLSLIWLTVLMGMLREPSWWRMILQVVILFAIFNTRYVALFYPVVAVLAFLLLRKKMSPVFKLTGIVASIGVVVLCTAWIKHLTYKETGVNMFSAFSAWQIAGNALHIYPYIPVDTNELPSPECRELAGYVQVYFDGPAARPVGDIPAPTDYMWLRNSPLHLYMADRRKKERVSYFMAWNRVAPVFSQYGYLLVRRHPVAFARYYGWMSLQTFFLAPLDVFGEYNMGSTSFDPVAKNWFRYSGVRGRVWSVTAQGKLLAPMPWIYLLLNGLFVVVTVLFLRSRALRERHPVFAGFLELAVAYLVSNACFSIFATPTIFRYQVLPMVLLFVFSGVGIALIAQSRTREIV
jgi:hypothetical protein